jgi:hypothetical protein
MTQFKQDYIYNKLVEETKKELEKEKDNKIICKDHYQKFFSFCIDCKHDICQECPQHSTHSKIKYFIPHEKIKKIKEFIDEFEKKKKRVDNDLIEIFKIIIKYYNWPYDNIIDLYKYPCMNLINTIENAYNCLDSLKKDKNKEKSQIKNANIYSNRNELIITSLKELTTKINAIDQIYEITISENNFKNLKTFENKKFPQLKILKLENNNIRDIGSLMKAKFNALYLLNL